MNDSDLPYSQACENNKSPILSVLNQAFANSQQVLEIGSGTGQHAVYFASQLAHLSWQSSDQHCNLPALAERIRRAALANLPPPLALDISCDSAPAQQFDGIFTANTLHIISWLLVKRLFSRLDEFAAQEATLCIYGPFNYQGQYTSASNQAFDTSLRSRDPTMGIRNSEDILQLAAEQGFLLKQDVAMPANNRLLWFKRKPLQP
jgi:cyclopropane fatty-acyl-phospholipid synthase-like methyltransferase